MYTLATAKPTLKKVFEDINELVQDFDNDAQGPEDLCTQDLIDSLCNLLRKYGVEVKTLPPLAEGINIECPCDFVIENDEFEMKIKSGHSFEVASLERSFDVLLESKEPSFFIRKPRDGNKILWNE